MEKEHLKNEKGMMETLKTNKVHSDADMLEEVLSHVGGIGRYQRLLIIGMIPFGFNYAFMYFTQIFVTITPQNHWCRVPELANLSMELRRNLSAPGADTGDWDHCKTFDVNWTKVLDTLIVPPPETPTVPCQYGWEFEFSDVPYETVVTERDWVCDTASYVPTAQSVFFAGAIVGTIIFGYIADRYGRIPAIIGSNLIGAFGQIATTFTTSTWDFMLCRFLTGLGFDNCIMLIYILVHEFVGPRYRTMVANIFMGTTFGCGALLLTWIALYVSNWRVLLYVTAMPMFLVLLAKWYIPESIRWLMSQGRVEEAALIVRKFESINGTKIPDEVMDEFMISSFKTNSKQEQSILDMFKSPPLYKAMFKMILLYMGATILLDGLTRLAGTFGMNLFTVFSFNEIFEILSIYLVAFFLDRCGRRKMTTFATLLAGVILFACLFVAKGLALATLAVGARFFASVSSTSINQWVTEILPTPLRATGASIIHLCTFVAIIFSTFIAYSERIWSMLPLFIIIAVAVVTTYISITLPETTGKPLPQTMADGEKLINDYSLCGKAEDALDGPYKRCDTQ